MAALLYFVGALIEALAPDYAVLVIGRFVFGLGIGLVWFVLDRDVSSYLLVCSDEVGNHLTYLEVRVSVYLLHAWSPCVDIHALSPFPL